MDQYTYCTLQVDRWTYIAGGLTLVVELHYRWTYIADGLTLQVDLHYKRTSIAGGFTLQVDLHYRWTYIAGGLTLQVDLQCRRTNIAGRITLQVDLHCSPGGITLQVDLHCRWTYIAGGLTLQVDLPSLPEMQMMFWLTTVGYWRAQARLVMVSVSTCLHITSHIWNYYHRFKSSTSLTGAWAPTNMGGSNTSDKRDIVLYTFMSWSFPRTKRNK